MTPEKMRHWLQYAYKLALQSPDMSTQNGAILLDGDFIIGKGWNGLPHGVANLPQRHNKPAKYLFFEHAERAAIYAAITAEYPDCIPGSTMVACWAACFDCARAIICCGIKRLVTHKQAYDRTPIHWKENVDGALALLKEAGVEVLWYEGKVGLEQQVRHSGQLWMP